MQFPMNPKFDYREESPTLRTEDPRQKTYAYRNADIIARERGIPRPFLPEYMNSRPNLPQDPIQNTSDAHLQRCDDIFPRDDWNQGNMATVGGLNSFSDNGKINAINANNRHLDTEMAYQSTNSGGPTSQSNSSYNHSSSNTSYSPSQAHEDDQIASGTGGGDKYMMGFVPPSHNTIFTREGAKHTISPPVQQQHDPFKVLAGWDMGTGLTPSPRLNPGTSTDMPPDAGWEKLMDSMGWETGKTG